MIDCKKSAAIGVEKPVGITQGKIIYQAVVLQANRQFSSVTMDEGSYSRNVTELLTCLREKLSFIVSTNFVFE